MSTMSMSFMFDMSISMSYLKSLTHWSSKIYSIHWVFEAHCIFLCLCLCICLCVHHIHDHRDHVLHVHVHIIFEILKPPALQKYNIHWVFEALYICLCLCICLCVCHWHRQMTGDIILCPAVYDLWGQAWSWDDIKGLCLKSWSDDRQTDKQTDVQLVDSIPFCRRGSSEKIWAGIRATCPLWDP